jgi:anaerobic selenocysteine-containing dehydrogenase
MAVARVLFERGWVDREAPSYCDNFEVFRTLAMQHSSDTWCRLADVPQRCAEDLARRLGPEKPCAILVGWGLGRRVHGAVTVRALDALGAISGNLGVPGGGVSFYFRRRSAFTTSFTDRRPARTLCEPLFGSEILAQTSSYSRWITSGNPM